MITNKYLRKVVSAYNSWIYASRRRISLTISAQELPSPKPRLLHRVGYNKIRAMSKGISDSITISGITNTNSMEPLIDEGHLALIEDPPRKEDLIVEDIILFFRVIDRQRVLHRIIEVGVDENGWYCITRGDNTVWIDGKIRYNNVLGVCVGIIY